MTKDEIDRVGRDKSITDNYAGYGSLNGTVKAVGSVQGYHPFGECLHGDTKVFNLNGDLTSIESVFNDTKQFLTYAYCKDQGKFVPVIAHSVRIEQYTDKLYHIKLSDGHVIKLTGNHPFLTMVRGDISVNIKKFEETGLEWKRTDELKIGDILFSGKVNDNSQITLCGNRDKQDLVEEIVYGFDVEHHDSVDLSGIIHVGYKDNNHLNVDPSNLILIKRSDALQSGCLLHYSIYDDYWGRDSREIGVINDKSTPDSELNKLLDKLSFLRVADITVEDLDKSLPTYDFTVDDYENIILPTQVSPLFNEFNFCVVHNSSTIGSLVYV